MQHTIIGLGWLGQSLAEHLSQQGHNVIGTVRQTEKQHVLANKGVNAHIFDCYQKLPTSLASTLFEHRNVIISIAAGRRNLDPHRYIDAIQNLIDIATASRCRKIIFISATSVFADDEAEITNLTKPKPTSSSGFAHYAIEKYLLSAHQQSNVLRLAGLVGPNPDKGYRHPIHSLALRSVLSDPSGPVNLIHKQDVISTIHRLLEQNYDGRAFNLCSHEHPTRVDYYQWCAKQLDLPPLSFVNKDRGSGKTKRINAKDTLETLGLTLDFTTPYDMLS